MNQFFVEALDIREHPIKKAKMEIRIKYINALTYIIEKTIDKRNSHQTEIKEFVDERLRLYQPQLLADTQITNINEELGVSCLLVFTKPWRRKYQFMLVCDITLILLEEPLVFQATAIIKGYLWHKHQGDIEQLVSLLHDERGIEKKYSPVSSLIKQYRVNNEFFSRKERKIIVTGNMSVGKSTLINALVGKPVTRTSQEVCTGNVCYLFNKAYEDENIHLLAQDLNLKATEEDLKGCDWNGHISIASYFVETSPNIPRLCIIDTPGIDAVLYKEHSKRAHNVLLNENSDMIVYIASPTQLGSDAERKHLQWVAQNLPKDKVVFVLNKLDAYRNFSDRIDESVYNFKEDLLEIGFKDPIICPISAYFSYLLKLRINGQTLSEDEADEYALYSRKFMRHSYDLSRYYDGVQCLPADSEEIMLSKRAGLYGFEKIIYGGRL